MAEPPYSKEILAALVYQADELDANQGFMAGQARTVGRAAEEAGAY